MKASTNLPGIFAAVFPSVSEAPIRLQGKAIEHVFESAHEILGSIRNYYVNETLKQIYKIIGSLDFVGNPTMVLNSFVTGVRDFFVHPSQEFLRSPKNPSRLGIGVAKGTLSLVSHSASGLFGFFAKMSATAGQAAAALSFDDDYKQWHRDMILSEAKNLTRQWKKRGTGKLSAIVTRPLLDVLRGVALGTTGLVLSPYKGAIRGGGAGLAKGLAIGTVGAVVKPMVGVFDAVTHFTGSIHDVAKSVNLLEKRLQPVTKFRPPYTFGLLNVLLPFNSATVRCVELLRAHPMSVKRRQSETGSSTWDEVHVASEILDMEPGTETILIVSTRRIVLFKASRDHTSTLVHNLCWEIQISGTVEITSRIQEHGHNGVALTISTRAESPTVSFLPSPLPAQQHSSQQPVVSAPVPRAIGLDRSESDDDIVSTKVSGDVDDMLGHDSTNRVHETQWTHPHENKGQLRSSRLTRSQSRNDDDTLEWFTVLAEFHHRQQLARLHNAICCVCGNIDAIVNEQGLSPYGSDEGYRTFGQFLFDNRDRTGGEGCTLVAEELEDIPWLSRGFLLNHMGKPQSEIVARFREVANSWTTEQELAATVNDGDPRWLRQARARAFFADESNDGGRLNSRNDSVPESQTKARGYPFEASRNQEGRTLAVTPRQRLTRIPKKIMTEWGRGGRQSGSHHQFQRSTSISSEAGSVDDASDAFFSASELVSVSSDAKPGSSQPLTPLSALKRIEAILPAAPGTADSPLRSSVRKAFRKRQKARPQLEDITEHSSATSRAGSEAAEKVGLADKDGRSQSIKHLSIHHSSDQGKTKPAMEIIVTKPESSATAPPPAVAAKSVSSTSEEMTGPNRLEKMESMLEQLLKLSLQKAADDTTGRSASTDFLKKAPPIDLQDKSSNNQAPEQTKAEQMNPDTLWEEVKALRTEIETKKKREDSELVALRSEVAELREQLRTVVNDRPQVQTQTEPGGNPTSRALFGRRKRQEPSREGSSRKQKQVRNDAQGEQENEKKVFVRAASSLTVEDHPSPKRNTNRARLTEKTRHGGRSNRFGVRRKLSSIGFRRRERQLSYSEESNDPVEGKEIKMDNNTLLSGSHVVIGHHDDEDGIDSSGNSNISSSSKTNDGSNIAFVTEHDLALPTTPLGLDFDGDGSGDGMDDRKPAATVD